MLDITTLAAWGEFIGGIAVVASLVYLASQIRQSAKIGRVTAAQMNAEQWSADARMLIQDAEVARIYYAGIEDRDLLPDWIDSASMPFCTCSSVATPRVISSGAKT